MVALGERPGLAAGAGAALVLSGLAAARAARRRRRRVHAGAPIPCRAGQLREAVAAREQLARVSTVDALAAGAARAHPRRASWARASGCPSAT